MRNNIFQADGAKAAAVFGIETDVVNDPRSNRVGHVAFHFHAGAGFHLRTQAEVFLRKAPSMTVRVVVKG